MYLGMAFRHRNVVFSLQCRGKHVEDMNKMDLLDLLYDDIVLEKKACLIHHATAPAVRTCSPLNGAYVQPTE